MGYDPGGLGEAYGDPSDSPTDDRGDAAAEPPAEPPRVVLVRRSVQRGMKKVEEQHWLCPLCNADEPEVGAAVQTAMKGSIPAQCTKDWARGRQLQGDAAHSFSQCECFVTAPYEESEHGGKKTDKEKLHFKH